MPNRSLKHLGVFHLVNGARVGPDRPKEGIRLTVSGVGFTG